MPRRKDVNEWKTDSRGRYRRMIGWKEEGGKRVQQPFYLGTNLDQAKARYIRVKELWAHLEKRHEVGRTSEGPHQTRSGPTECKWDNVSLWVARELAAGGVQVVVPFTERGPQANYARKLAELAESYPIVHFVPEEHETYEVGRKTLQTYVKDSLARFHLPLTNVVAQVTASFHAAIDEYIEHIQKSALEPSPDGPRMTAFGHVKVEQAKRIKSRQKDRPLSSLDLQGCQELLDYWRMRPLTEATKRKPARPMEVRYCENHIAELSRFFRWLHKTKLFDWRKPEDFDELETRVKDLPEERTNIDFLSVDVFTVEQLAILNKYATPLERLLLLLGLNCGFKGAEQGTLRFDHLFLVKPHPHAATIRERTGFDPEAVAGFDEARIEALLADPGIVRNRLKVTSAVKNARAFLRVQEECGSFDGYIWRFVDGQPVVNDWHDLSQIPARTPLSDAISKDLKKRGFTFVGTTICYAMMQATGLVNDHLVGCFRHAQVRD